MFPTGKPDRLGPRSKYPVSAADLDSLDRTSSGPPDPGATFSVTTDHREDPCTAL
jgi:hypothetical protein